MKQLCGLYAQTFFTFRTALVFHGLTQRNFNAIDKNVVEFMLQKCEDCLLVTRKIMNEGTGSCSVPCRFCGKIWKPV